MYHKRFMFGVEKEPDCSKFIGKACQKEPKARWGPYRNFPSTKNVDKLVIISIEKVAGLPFPKE